MTTIKEALHKDIITKIRNMYRCNECNIMHDSPFEAIICVKGHKEIETKEDVYFRTLDEDTKRMLRREYSEDDYLYKRYKTVSHYAYDVK